MSPEPGIQESVRPATGYRYALFETAIGRFGIAWSERGVAGVQLPEGRETETRARMRRRFPDAYESPPSAEIQRAPDDIVALLGGQPRALDDVALDMEGVPAFHRRIYRLARAIPPGRTLSYGEIAARAGAAGAARAVGQALGRNPFPIVVPCHWVVAADGKLGGFSANGGVRTKLRLLSIEGARAGGQLPMFEGDGAFAFDPEAAMAHLRQADPPLARAMDRVGPFRMELKRAPSLFAALAEAIVYQQLTGKAAATIFARVCALFPRGHQGPTPDQVGRVSDGTLRAAGLSRAKVLSLRDLTQRARAGQIPTLAEAQAMDDEAIVERLTEIRGIGRWTAQMLLMFRLGRPDVLPVDDYGIRKGFAMAFGKRQLPTRAAVEARGARWKPYRTVASWYLWRLAEPGDRMLPTAARGDST